MSNKTIGILLVFCAVFAYFGLRDSSSTKGNNIIANTTPFKNLALNSINKIKIIQGKKEINLDLSSESKTWSAKIDKLNFPVDFSKLKTFLISIKDISLIDKKANSDKYDQKFGLDDKSNPITINLLVGEKSLSSIKLGSVRKGNKVGTGSYSYTPDEGHYLKIGSEKNVYLSKEKLDIEMNNDFWLNKEIIKIDKNEITSIDLTFPHKTINLKIEKTMLQTSANNATPPQEITTWVAKGDLPEGKSLNQNEIKNFLTTLEKCEVTEPAESSMISKMSHGENYSIVVKKEEAELYSLNFTEIAGKWYTVSSLNADQIYIIDASKVEKIFAQSKSLFNLKELSIVSKLDSLTTMTGLSFKNNKDKWSFDGSSPKPELKESALKDFAETVKKLQLEDYHLKNIIEKKKESISFKDGEREVTITYVNDLSLNSQKLIRISGIKGYYSISNNEYNKLFIAQKDSLKFEAKPTSADEVTSIKFPSFKLSKKDDKWMSGDKSVEKNRVSDWIDSLKNVFDSPYSLKANKFTPENLISLKGKDNKDFILKISVPAKGYAKVNYSEFGGDFTVKLEVIKSLLKAQKNFLTTIDQKPKSTN